jgi:NAD(P)-dependent dehydrogenase (short-subunit alcohol dehydrogenase family)
MSGALQGAVALITGGAGSIGSATARRLHDDGAQVVIADVRTDDAQALADEVDGLAVTLDVREDESWAGAIAAAVERFGKLTVLVNNAGIGDPAGFEEMPMESWHQHLAINQTGVLLGMRHAAPAMRAAGGGSIVNLSSVHGLVARSIGGGTAMAYTATKGAVRLMSKAAAVELAGEGIRVNSVHPGYLDAPMVGVEQSPYRQRAKELTPMRRFARAEEVAAGIAFLASPDASYITGSELVIDGGYTAV